MPGTGSCVLPCSRRLRPAFTLVELLVVVSIIALLISILLPSLRKAKNQAVALQCASHLRDLGQGMQIYANENDGNIPRDIGTGFGSPFDALLPVLGIKIEGPKDANDRERFVADMGKVGFLQCARYPKDVVDVTRRMMPDQKVDYVANGFPSNYEPYGDKNEDVLLDEPDPNGFLRTIPPRDKREAARNLNSIRNIAGVIYATEGHAQLSRTRFTYHDVYRGSQLPRGIHPRIAIDDRHPGGINNVFFDTHTEKRRPVTLIETDFYFSGKPSEQPQD